jgi:hypothetical protein
MPRFYGLDSHSPSSHGANELILARKREREGANPSRILVAQLVGLPHPHPTRAQQTFRQIDQSSVPETAPDRLAYYGAVQRKRTRAF